MIHLSLLQIASLRLNVSCRREPVGAPTRWPATPNFVSHAGKRPFVESLNQIAVLGMQTPGFSIPAGLKTHRYIKGLASAQYDAGNRRRERRTVLKKPPLNGWHS